MEHVKKYIWFAVALLIATSCATQNKIPTDFKTLTVSKGNHEFKPANHSVWLFAPDAITYEVIFDSTVIYHNDRSTNDHDWNKGGGISFSLVSHHRNSVMWAWRWQTVGCDCIELTWYAHIDGKTVYGEPIAKANIGEKFRVDIMDIGKVWRVLIETKPDGWGNFISTIDNRDLEAMVVGNLAFRDVPISKSGLSKHIPAWFGGDAVAPFDITMAVKFSLKK